MFFRGNSVSFGGGNKDFGGFSWGNIFIGSRKKGRVSSSDERYPETQGSNDW